MSKMMVHQIWDEAVPTGVVLGVEVWKYVESPHRGRYDPETVLERIAPSFEGEQFSPSGYQVGHYISLSDLIHGNDSLKYLKKWPRDAQLEAGRFLRYVWRKLRELGHPERGSCLADYVMVEAYIPRTDLGRLLAFLRKRALDRGIKELSEEEILREIRKRRCGEDADSREDT